MWGKFSLLMWKNWLLVWRRKFMSLFEIMLPVFFSALLVLMRGLSEPDVYTVPFHYQPLELVNATWPW